MDAQKEITALLKKLISFKTTADNPEELNKCIDFVKSYLPKNLVARKYTRNRKPSLVVTLEKTKKPKLLFVCHLDVVPARDKLFFPKIRGNRLYARGSHDDKGSAAALIFLMKELAMNKERQSVGLILTTDEEVGGENGLGFLLNKEKYGCDFAIVPDAGKDFNIVIKEKGVLRAKITAKGKSAHGSKPWKGDNAIEKLMNAYLKVKGSFPRTTPKNRWKATICLVNIRGGEAANKVPDYAEAELDIRFTEKEPVRKLIEKIRKNAKIRGVGVEFSLHKAPLIVEPKNSHIMRLKDSLEKVLGRKVELEYEHGASDASFFSDSKIPVALVMPKGGNAHGDGEYIELKSLYVFYKLMKNFIRQNE